MTERRSQTIRQPETKTGGGDSDRLAHIVTREEQMRGYVAGEPIKALCGKVWVPTRDYHGLPICQACIEQRDRRISGIRGLN